ncbi:hypothetical protein [Streptomyces viridosporus]|uniref:hypothetical protein n=1 Tax=Streptomyces viridosporus TaxID=67581 RepID=UPI0036FCE26D
MTAHPVPGNAGHWWLVAGKWRRLHAVPASAISTDVMREAIDWDLPLIRHAACALRRCWWMPGIASRFGLRRCTACCRALGIPPGHGTPANENHRKEPAT